MNNKKQFISFIIFLIITINSYSQVTLNKNNTSWSTVLPGTVLCEPVETSYGFCIVTDARNVIGFSNSGKQLWEKSIGSSRNFNLAVLIKDFILLHEKNENILRLLNPSGSELWSTNLDILPREKPFCGRDGRFFIYSDTEIRCYGINGICKWKLQTELQKNLPAQELPDGSLIIFLTDVDGKTQGIRISPFGEVMEEITFSGSIIKSYYYNNGILLVFSDGSSGLFSLEDNVCKNKWVIPFKSSNTDFVVSNDKSQFLFLDKQDNFINYYQIDDNGLISKSSKIQNINGKQILKSYLNNSGLFICDNQNAYLFSQNGSELWNAKLPSLSNLNWNYLLILKSNYLIFCSKDWSLLSYRIAQNLKINDKKIDKSTYDSFYELYVPFDIIYSKSFDSKILDNSIYIELKNGNYGNKEKKWISEILSVCNYYAQDLRKENFGIRDEKSIFETETRNFEKILYQLTLYNNDNTQKTIASIIRNTENFDYIITLLKNISGYDPDGLLLNSINYRADIVNPKDIALINAICDSVYNICKFMGRPAYNSLGKEILKTFLSSNFNIQTRKYASDTLKKIVDLEL